MMDDNEARRRAEELGKELFCSEAEVAELAELIRTQNHDKYLKQLVKLETRCGIWGKRSLLERMLQRKLRAEGRLLLFQADESVIN